MPTHVPPGHTLAAALRDSEPLVGLLARVRESQARLAVVTELLPVGLRGDVRAGPLDDTAWVLLVDHASGAAKLRQLLPNLEQALARSGRPGPPIKVKVLPRG
jgi:hypothetical protein